jgi:hypothetical protein
LEAVLTAVFVHLTSPGMRLRCRAFGVRLLTALALVLPVPVFAVLGLSLPLPATVERIAARLVPFGTGETRSAAVDGIIVFQPGEQRSSGGAIEADGSPVSSKRSVGLPAAGISRPRATSPSADTTTDVAAPEGKPRGSAPTDGGPRSGAPSTSAPSTSAPSTNTSSDDAAPGPGGTQSGGSEPAQPSLVDTTQTAVNGVVNTTTTAASETVAPVAETAKGVVEIAEGIAGGPLGPVRP